MRKVMSIVGTRPELIKMCRVIALLDEQTQHVLVHTGQNYDYGLNQVFFEDLDIRKPDHFLEAAGGSAIDTIAEVLKRSDAVMEQEKPDAMLIYGDTNSGLAVIAAKRRKIPVFHMEAGNRCFDQRVPEELNRKVIDHLSDINMTLTEHARRYLLAEGLPPELTFNVGSHMHEVLEHFRPRYEASDILGRLGLTERQFFVVSSHREENVDSERNLADLLDSLKGLAETYDWPVIVSTHPRTRKRLEALGETELDPRIRFLPPFGFHDYIKLQMTAACVVSDSGTITEESSLLGFPAVTIRQAHERPEGMDEGTLVMCGLTRESVLDSVRFVIRAHAAGLTPRPVADYVAGPVSRKVVAIVLSYIDYVNRTVWRKS
ncbi:UDP-N-acetylglucosamine 2-epimerase (non-hydrolyzing) [Bosea sp. F3-2]|uniref:non-hydrolyzing UDP-N-acetylglucosamine 2-epimerase n=1 Tax=Bosea sp. F3-2 TaxID=2599640 RepID=UPI0011EBE3CB|nr:UDP-N-acetylglucosamine 2-epimerase (non-hydrolyzing) [Bosea sp. F3-2]QEL23964.1 UDP-N-acetylglucosamine 2-epimerase (non-hydrolyzing) [Bosea sp. F3-2]